jgi:putative Mg2+ transporter-C (MgtC) family protein
MELGLDKEIVLQIVMAVLLGGAIGFEREIRGRAAGLRTMILVCLGSTLVMIVSGYLTATFEGDTRAAFVRVDPARIAAGIVTGIGFLGAGVIIKLGDLIRGVTTAATIWFVAALGIAVGDRRYGLAVVSTAIALAVLSLLHFPERMLKSHIYRVVRVKVSSPCVDAVLAQLQTILSEAAARMLDLRAEQNVDEGTTLLEIYIRTDQRLLPQDAVKRLAALEGVRSVGWQ